MSYQQPVGGTPNPLDSPPRKTNVGRIVLIAVILVILVAAVAGTIYAFTSYSIEPNPSPTQSTPAPIPTLPEPPTEVPSPVPPVP